MIRGGDSLLPAPPADLVDGLARLEPVLAEAFPLKPKHRAMLPRGVAALSALLTTDREDLPRDYMARPEHLSAYLHWFLPWNVYRQGRLLAGLGLDLPDGARITDVGAGPLTFLHALWLACPDLRARKLHYEAVDRAEPALKAGRTIFAGLAGEAADRWHVVTRGGAAGGRPGTAADLVVAANMINELDNDRSGRRRGPDVDAAERLVMGWEKMVAPGGRLTAPRGAGAGGGAAAAAGGSGRGQRQQQRQGAAAAAAAGPGGATSPAAPRERRAGSNPSAARPACPKSAPRWPSCCCRRRPRRRRSPCAAA